MNTLYQFIYDYGIVAILVLVFLEYACFPLSSEILLPLSGAIAYACNWSFPLIVICSSIAGLLGTYLIFVMSDKLTYIFIKKKSSCTNNRAPISTCQNLFNQTGKYAVMFGRIIPLCRTYIAFPAGMTNMNSKEYLIYSFSGILIWNSVLIGSGYLLGANSNLISKYYSQYKTISIILIITILILIITIKLIKNRIHIHNKFI